MPGPTPSWNTCRVHGTWFKLDGTRRTGSYKVTIPVRVTNVPDDAIIPSGVALQGTLNTDSGFPSLDIQVPSNSDPDNSPNGWQPIIEVTFPDAPGEKYVIDTPVDGSVNLRTIVLAESIPVPKDVLIRGVPGGLATLDAEGKIPTGQIPDDIAGLDEAALETYLAANPPSAASVVETDTAKVFTADERIKLAGLPSSVPAASSTTAGLARFASNAEAVTGTSAVRAVTPAALTASLGAFVALGLDSTGVADSGPALQALYDSGERKIVLKRGGTYLVNSPVFVDSTNFGDKLEIDLNGATLNLGTGLPTANGAFTPDATVKVAFFVNTARAGLASGNVDVQGNRATSAGASLRFVLRNGRVNAGNSNNVIVAFGNRCGTLMENVNLIGGRGLWSWYDYAEPHIMRNCHFQTAGGANQVGDAFLLYGVAKGDGILVESIKCDGAVGGVSLRECFGATLNSFITAKIRLTRCAGIVINGAHMESDIYTTYEPNVEVFNSDVTVIGGAFYPPLSATGACFVIDDTDGNNNLHSTVTLIAPEAKYLGKTDQVQGSLVRVKAVNSRSNTVVSVQDAKAKTSGVSASGAGTWRATALAPITSDVAAIQTALTNGRGQIAAGSFELSRLDSGWAVSEIGSGGWRRSRALSAPTFVQIANATDVTGGTLTNGQAYEYAIAAVDGMGNYTTHAVQSYTSSTAQANRILLSNTKNVTLVLWRKTGTGVASSPDRYVVLCSTTNNLVLFDHGDNVSGQPWVTTGVPVPTTIAATNATRTGLLTPGGEFLSGIQAAVDSKAPASRTVNGQPLTSNVTLAPADLGLPPFYSTTPLTAGATLPAVTGQVVMRLATT